MKVAFIHDAPLRLAPDGMRYGVAFNYKTWKRYLKVFDSLVVCTRQGNISGSETNGYSISSGENVSFAPCKAYKSPPDAILHRKEIRKHIEQVVSQVDACIIRLPSMLGNFAVSACKKLSKPYLIEVVACPWDSLWNHSWQGKILAPIKMVQTKKNVKTATHAIYVTNGFLQGRYPANGQWIHCSNVSLPFWDDTILEHRLVKIAQNQKLKPISLATTAAVNVRYKGQEYVIRAVAQLKEKGIQATYHLAGGGDNTYLKAVAKKYGVERQINFLGSLPHDKVFEMLDDIDIYIQPSKQEGLPRAVIEAMSRGCPVIGSRTGGTPELCNPKYVFENGNVEQIVDMVMSMTGELEQEAKRSFEKAKEYRKEVLEGRRTEFLRTFIQDCSMSVE